MNEAKNLRNQTVTRVYPAVFITASLGGLSFLAFSNGLLLAYFSRLEISSSEILLLLALPSILQFMLVLVFSYFRTGSARNWSGQQAYSAQQAHFIFFGRLVSAKGFGDTVFQWREWFFSGSGRPCRSATGLPCSILWSLNRSGEGFSAGSDWPGRVLVFFFPFLYFISSNRTRASKFIIGC